MDSLSRCIWNVNLERRTDGDEIGADMLHVISKTRFKQDVRLCARLGACVRQTRLTYPPLLHVCVRHYRGHKVAATTTSKAGAIVVVCPETAKLFLLHTDLADFPYSRGHLAAVKGIQTGLQVCGAHHAATRSDSKSMHAPLSFNTLHQIRQDEESGWFAMGRLFQQLRQRGRWKAEPLHQMVSLTLPSGVFEPGNWF